MDFDNRHESVLGYIPIVVLLLGFGVWILIDISGAAPSDREETTTTEATATSPAPPGSLEISIYSSDTKEDWLNTVAERFNEARTETSAGDPIYVHVNHVKSGGSKQDILDGKVEPTIWSPGDQSWVDSINETWTDRTGDPLIPEECHATVYAPVGFAMWRPMAEAMGWPDEPIGWDEMVELAADPEGWGRYGHPEWGPFKFGHTHPDHSNSGLLLMSALVYSTLDRTDGLTAELVKSDEVVEAMRAVELNTHHYGSSSRFNSTRMVDRGPDYLHATNASEAETLRTNSGVYGEPRFPLAFIFPAEGTFWAEHPYCVLDAEWVSEEQAEAARIFGEYLLAPEQQALTVENFLRPVDGTVPLADPFTVANGTDPRVTQETVPALASLSPEVTGAVQDVFRETKKKATVVIVLDTSSSMSGAKIRNAREATAGFIDQLAQDDAVYVYSFSTELSPAGRASEVKETLEQKVLELRASGGTPLLPAICASVQRVTGLQKADAAAGEPRLYGIVVLSDGQDGSDMTESELFKCLPSGEAVQGPKIFTIAYGNSADEELLAEISDRTDAKMFSGDPDTIGAVYKAISAEQ